MEWLALLFPLSLLYLVVFPSVSATAELMPDFMCDDTGSGSGDGDDSLQCFSVQSTGGKSSSPLPTTHPDPSVILSINSINPVPTLHMTSFINTESLVQETQSPTPTLVPPPSEPVPNGTHSPTPTSIPPPSEPVPNGTHSSTPSSVSRTSEPVPNGTHSSTPSSVSPTSEPVSSGMLSPTPISEPVVSETQFPSPRSADDDYFGLTLLELLAGVGGVLLLIVLFGLVICVGVVCCCQRKRRSKTIEEEKQVRDKSIQLLSFITISRHNDETDIVEETNQVTLKTFGRQKPELMTSVEGTKRVTFDGGDDTQEKLQDETITLATFGLPSVVIEAGNVPEVNEANPTKHGVSMAVIQEGGSRDNEPGGIQQSVVKGGKSNGVREDKSKDNNPGGARDQHILEAVSTINQLESQLPAVAGKESTHLDDMDKALGLVPDDLKTTSL